MLQYQCLHILSIPKESLATAITILLVSTRYMLLGFAFWLLQFMIIAFSLLFYWLLQVLVLSHNHCFIEQAWHKLLAHLSWRLIGELIGYLSSVRLSVGSQWSKIFFSKTTWPIKAKFYVEPPWVGGMKVCSRHLGHMTKMAATPIYGKNPSKIFFSRTGRQIFTKLGM